MIASSIFDACRSSEHQSIVLTSINFSNINCWIARRHQHQSQKIRHIRSVNSINSFALSQHRASYCNIHTQVTYELLITLASQHDIVVVNNTNNLIYLSHSSNEFDSKNEWQFINRTSFCFVKRTSTIRHLKRAYLSINDQKITHLQTFVSFSVFHFIRNSISRYHCFSLLAILYLQFNSTYFSSSWHLLQ